MYFILGWPLQLFLPLPRYSLACFLVVIEMGTQILNTPNKNELLSPNLLEHAGDLLVTAGHERGQRDRLLLRRTSPSRRHRHRPSHWSKAVRDFT